MAEWLVLSEGQGDWMRSAVCRLKRTDPDSYFPEALSSAGAAKRAAAARKACSVCPVRSYCLALALVQKERHGIWGGLAERARREERRRRQAAEIPLGAVLPLTQIPPVYARSLSRSVA